MDGRVAPTPPAPGFYRRDPYRDQTWPPCKIGGSKASASQGRCRMVVRRPRLAARLHHDRIVARWLVDGPINADSLRLDIGKVLIPTPRPGDIVLMDIVR